LFVEGEEQQFAWEQQEVLADLDTIQFDRKHHNWRCDRLPFQITKVREYEVLCLSIEINISE
jgi:hypothetical protein